MNERIYFVYILASKKNGTLYIGIKNNILRRVLEHKDKILKGFTAKYNVDKLVYFERFGNVDLAIKREKMLKEWHRKWKTRLIEENNKEWKDLFYDLISEEDIESLRIAINEREEEKKNSS
jgi:putative endonuclease